RAGIPRRSRNQGREPHLPRSPLYPQRGTGGRQGSAGTAIPAWGLLRSVDRYSATVICVAPAARAAFIVETRVFALELGCGRTITEAAGFSARCAATRARTLLRSTRSRLK